MTRAVLISINPPYTQQIFSGEKDIEWRKTALPFGKAYVYETKKNGGCGMVIGTIEISGNHIYRRGDTVPARYIRRGCVPIGGLMKYAGEGDKAKLVANFIGNEELFDEPRPLGSFYQWKNYGMWSQLESLSRPPQSWQHIEVKE